MGTRHGLALNRLTAHRTAVSCWGSAAPLFLGLLLGACPEPEVPAAHVQRVSGTVTVREGGTGARGTAQVEQALYAGDVVTTGDDGAAVLQFAGGNNVEVGADTTMVVGAAGGASAQVGAVLLGGVARARSGAQGVVLRIGTPFGVTQVGVGQSDLAVSARNGIRVLVGNVDILTESGERRTLSAGQALLVDGLVVPVGGAVDGLSFPLGGQAEVAALFAGKRPETAVVLEPMSFVLLSNPKHTQIKRAGSAAWQRPSKRIALKAGDAVRTRRGEAVVQLGDHAGVTVRANSQLLVGESKQSAELEQVTYALEAGGAVVALQPVQGKKIEHHLQVGGQEVTLRPGLRQGSMEVTTDKNGVAQLAVRLGQAELGDGSIIEAGRVVELFEGKMARPETALASSQVDLRPRSSVLIYVSDRIPAVRFVWPKGRTEEPYRFELATDRALKALVAQEALQHTSFVFDRLRMGRYYWRVRLDGDWAQGLFSVSTESSTDCAKCKRDNLIDDTGEKTVVYFQQALPAIGMRWKAAAGAATYRLKVFADGEFDEPLIDESTQATKNAFPAGRLKEGRYYWLVSALDGSGNEVATGRMNSLEIAYDNVVTALVIKTPLTGSRVTYRTATTTGEIELGAKLYVNGKRVATEDNGRFRHTVSLQQGSNQVLYRLVTRDGTERYYFRTLHRQ